MTTNRRSFMQTSLTAASAALLSSERAGASKPESSSKQPGSPTLSTECHVNSYYTQRVSRTGINDMLGRTRFPMLDTRQLREADGVSLRCHPAQKHGDPMIVGDRYGETGVTLYGSVLHDGQRYRMWYQPIWEKDGNSYSVSYAESSDGIHWDKPELGEVEWRGSRKNNLLKMYGHSPSVVNLGLSVPPERRYLGIAIGLGKRGYPKCWSIRRR